MSAANSNSIEAKQDAQNSTVTLSRLDRYGFLRDMVVAIWNAIQLLMFHQSVKVLLLARKLNY